MNDDNDIVVASANGAYAFTYDKYAKTWHPAQKLNPKVRLPGGNLGYNVGINDNTIAASSPAGGGPNGVWGANDRVYIFTKTGKTWTETQVIAPPVYKGKDVYFGGRMAMSKDRLMVSSPNTPDRVYIYERDNNIGHWNLTHTLKGSGMRDGTGVWYGSGLAMGNDIIVVGASNFAEGQKGTGRDHSSIT